MKKRTFKHLAVAASISLATIANTSPTEAEATTTWPDMHSSTLLSYLYDDINSGRRTPQNGDILQILDYCIYGPMKPDAVIGSPAGPEIYLTCGAHRHINNRHRANFDKESFLTRPTKVNTRGSNRPATSAPNTHRSWKNRHTGTWGNTVDNYTNGLITTAFTSGPGGGNWASFAR